MISIGEYGDKDDTTNLAIPGADPLPIFGSVLKNERTGEFVQILMQGITVRRGYAGVPKVAILSGDRWSVVATPTVAVPDPEMCVCGHDAYDHEDRLTDASAAPCKVCGCEDFEE